MNRTGDYAALAQLAREKREQGEYQSEMMDVLRCCRAAKARMSKIPPLTGDRARIWAHLVDVIDLAEQELKRMRGER